MSTTAIPQIEIPVKPFSIFIKSAYQWLSKTNDTKKNRLELRLFKEDDCLHVSVGLDSSYMEAVLEAQASALNEPIFLDLSHLSSYQFDSEPLYLVIPKKTETTNNIEKRAQFKAQGHNFRIPILPGKTWEKNEQDLSEFEKTAGFNISKQAFDSIHPFLKLPDSFDQKKPARVAFEKISDNKFQCYSDDQFGSFWHCFETQDFSPLNEFQRLVLLNDFLLPYKKIDEFTSLTVKQSDRVSFAEIHGLSNGFKKLRWLQPNYVGYMENIPAAVKEVRAKIDSSLTFDTAEFLNNVEKATIFFKGEDYQQIPLEFSVIESSYALAARTTDSEMLREGKILNTATSSLRLNFQASCLTDYLRCLDRSQELNMEILTGGVIIYQKLQNEKDILYWLPTRTG
jgi:hypothetical protein